MITRLVKHGNDLALVIDASILKQLQIDETTELDLATDGRRFVVFRTCDAEGRENFDRLFADINRRYSTTFTRLATDQ